MDSPGSSGTKRSDVTGQGERRRGHAGARRRGWTRLAALSCPSGGLNCVPPQRYVEVLTPNTSERDRSLDLDLGTCKEHYKFLQLQANVSISSCHGNTLF